MRVYRAFRVYRVLGFSGFRVPGLALMKTSDQWRQKISERALGFHPKPLGVPTYRVSLKASMAQFSS